MLVSVRYSTNLSNQILHNAPTVTETSIPKNPPIILPKISDTITKNELVEEKENGI